MTAALPTTLLAGTETSRLGLGCGRLVGNSGLKQSRHIVEAALALGIRHFDTAPSYGFGTSENVLGDVLAGDDTCTIVTKVGRPRPGGSGVRALARQVLRPILSGLPAVRNRLSQAVSGGDPGFTLSPSQIEASVAESLRRLRRDSVTGLLLHEIVPEVLDDQAKATMNGLLAGRVAKALGSGTGRARGELVPFGTISQFRWTPGETDAPNGDEIIHGVLRHFPRPQQLNSQQIDALRELGRDPADPDAWMGAALTLSLCERPHAVILISSTSAERIRRSISSIDWAMIGECTAKNLLCIREVLGKEKNFNHDEVISIRK